MHEGGRNELLLDLGSLELSPLLCESWTERRRVTESVSVLDLKAEHKCTCEACTKGRHT